MRREVLPLLIGASLWVGLVAPVESQTTNRKSFTSRSNENGVMADCTLRVRSNNVQTPNRRSFIARPRNHALSVSAVNGVNPALTNNIVDTRFDVASTLLQAAQNPPADVTCCISVTRTGNVATFTPPATMVGGVITTQAERDAVAAVGADVMVVNGIGFCTGTGTFTGCQTGGAILLVRARFNAGNEATIAHELGHREGLNHTGGCPPGTCGPSASCTCAGGGAATRDIMFCSACAGRDTISATECSAYQSNANQ